MQIADVILGLTGAWLFALLFRGRDLVVVTKNDSQRTGEERKKVRGGLARTLVVEFFILVPASTALILLVAPFLVNLLARSSGLAKAVEQSSDVRRGFYVTLGILSYNFPFVAVREIATRIALNTVKEFYLSQRKHDASVEREQPREL